jgi:Uma2 family endonuclease
MTALPKIRYTPEEYLAIDRQAPFKSEYRAGEIFAMAGASEEHNIITVNVTVTLGSQLRGGPCRPFAADMRVRVGPADLYAYPDVVVVCGERRFADEQRDVLLNPTVIIEVLSPSTEDYDRGDKFTGYRHLASLQEYLLVAQDRPHVEQYTRQPDGRWLRSEAAHLEAVIHLSSLAADLALSEVYADVNFRS